MATSVGLPWGDRSSHFKVSSRPATTSLSFCSYYSDDLQNSPHELKPRLSISAHNPKRVSLSLPSSPPRDERCKDEKVTSIKFHNGKCFDCNHVDKNKSKCLPEWFTAPSENLLDSKSTTNCPFDPQKRNLRQPEGDDDDCYVSDDSRQCSEDSVNIDPSSCEISKLNPLGQGHSRFLGLFNSSDSNNSTSDVPALKNEIRDNFTSSFSDDDSGNSEDEYDRKQDPNSHFESELDNGFEAVRQGLARLISISSDADKECSKENRKLRCLDFKNNKSSDMQLKSGSSGSRLLKLFNPVQKDSIESNLWSNSPLLNNSMWSSESSLYATATYGSNPVSQVGSPNIGSPIRKSLTPIAMKVPNVTSISPTAPLHVPATTFSGFPDSDTLSKTAFNGYTACDLSHEEAEIEAALERGEGFFTNDTTSNSPNNVATESSEKEKATFVDNTIWSPMLEHFSCISEELIDLHSVTPETLEKLAHEAAHDIINWLDSWIETCSFPNCLQQEKCSEPVQNSPYGEKDEQSKKFETFLQSNLSSENSFYKVNNPDGINVGPFLNHFNEKTLPETTDFVMTNREEENCYKNSSGLQPCSGQSGLQFLFNSRASNIYNSHYLLFPDLVQLSSSFETNKSPSFGGHYNSDFLTQIFSTSFGWMNSLDNVNETDQHLQALSPKTPFTPTANLSGSMTVMDRKQSISLEHLCNVTATATTLQGHRIDHTPFVSTDFLVQYMQSHFDYFENISLESEFINENFLNNSKSNSVSFKDGYMRLYRPVPVFPLQFINKLSLTSGSDNLEESRPTEDLYLSPKTHFRPITPSNSNFHEEGNESEGKTAFKCQLLEDNQSEDIDDELVAIHEGADHSKLAEIYAQMQLQQQIAAEKKHNVSQLVVVNDCYTADNENDDMELAYEEKQPTKYDVQDYALECAAEAAATAAVNALGSTEPEEALAMLEEWEWKECLDMSEKFTELGYFETYTTKNPIECPTEENQPFSFTCSSWSVNDDSSILRTVNEMEDIKSIWVKSQSVASRTFNSHNDFEKVSTNASGNHANNDNKNLKKLPLNFESSNLIPSEIEVYSKMKGSEERIPEMKVEKSCYVNSSELKEEAIKQGFVPFQVEDGDEHLLTSHLIPMNVGIWSKGNQNNYNEIELGKLNWFADPG